MQKRPSVKVTFRGAVYWKLARYLQVVNETNTTLKLEHYQEHGFLKNPEVCAEVVRLRGAAKRRGVGASIGKTKGGKPALFIADRRLKAIHIAKMKGLL